MQRIKVLIVNDSATVRGILSADADIEVAGRREDRLDAVAKAKELHPDGCADAVHGRGGG